MNKPYVKLDKHNAAVLLVDHQAGLSSLVRDIEPDKFRNNVLALAATAKYFQLPTILTTSFENGPNGPLMTELKETFPDAPYIARPGQINAWDNEEFVKAVKATGKKQLIIAGIVTEVCVAFPALSALEEGYEVFVITDASGTFNEITRHSAWDRMSSAGAQLMTWFGAACELHRDWRNDVEGLGTLFANHIPDYRNLINSYTTVQGPCWATARLLPYSRGVCKRRFPPPGVHEQGRSMYTVPPRPGGSGTPQTSAQESEACPRGARRHRTSQQGQRYGEARSGRDVCRAEASSVTARAGGGKNKTQRGRGKPYPLRHDEARLPLMRGGVPLYPTEPRGIAS